MKAVFPLIALGFLAQLCASSSDLSQEDILTLYKTLNGAVHDQRNAIEDAINAALDQFKELMLNGDEANGIPVMDPYLQKHFSYEINDELTDLFVEMDNMTITGGAGFSMDHVMANILFLEMELTFRWPELVFHADRYFLDSTIFQLIPLFGEGDFEFRATELTLAGHAKFGQENEQLSMQEFGFVIEFESLEGHIGGFLGGGELGEEINEILNGIGMDIFELIKDDISADVALMVQDFVNFMLDGYSLQDILDILLGNSDKVPSVAENALVAPRVEANDYVDLLLANLRDFMLENGMDHLLLPDVVESFSEDFLGITWHGEASLREGYLDGLETIHRSGDALLDYEGDAITVGAELQFNGLDGGYLMHVDFMDIGLEATAAVTITSLKIGFSTTILFDVNGNEVTINEFDIKDPGLIVVDFEGLGDLNFLLETLGFLVMNIFSGLILGAISDDLQAALQEILEGIGSPDQLIATFA